MFETGGLKEIILDTNFIITFIVTVQQVIDANICMKIEEHLLVDSLLLKCIIVLFHSLTPQMTMSLAGLTNGTLFGVFCLGVFCPRANAKVGYNLLCYNRGFKYSNNKLRDIKIIIIYLMF